MDNKYIIDYYSNYDEDNRLLRRHGQVEFLTTVRYVEKYLKSGMKVLEVGAGTGRYSLYFARKGYQVDSVELVEHNIDVFKEKMTNQDHINLQQGNALDLNMYEDSTFDVTLVLGPMYHVYNEQDKKRVIEEALRVTKKNGLIVIAYITHDAVIVEWGLIGKNLKVGKERNMFTEEYKCISNPEDLFAFFHIEEFNALANQFEVEHIHTVGTDGVSPLFREILTEMDEEEFNIWLEYHFQTCERKDLIGYSSHIIYMGRKK